MKSLSSQRHGKTWSENLNPIGFLLFVPKIVQNSEKINFSTKLLRERFLDMPDRTILAKFFFCVFMDRDRVKVHKLAKKEQGQFPAILSTEQSWSIKDLLCDFLGNYFSFLHVIRLLARWASRRPVEGHFLKTKLNVYIPGGNPK